MDFITLKNIITNHQQKSISFLESINPETDLDLKSNLFKNPITISEIEENLSSLETNLGFWAIYLIFADKNFKYEEIKSSYESTKNQGFKMSRMPTEENISSFEKSEKKCLYVGSCRNLKERLKSHLENPKSTYSLHLKKWFPTDKKLSLQIIEVKTENPEIMQLYEDFLWQEFKPLFGKQGKK